MNSNAPHSPSVPKLRLRALEPEDLDCLYAVENDESLWSCGINTVPYSRYTLKQYIATCSHDLYQDRQMRLAVEHDGRVVGFVDIIDFNPQHQRAEVGIVIFSDCRRQGFGSQALHLLAQLVCCHHPLHQLYAFVSAQNTAALRLFCSAGYTRSSTLADWLTFPDGSHADVHLMQLIL